MTTQIVVELDDTDLASLDELAHRDGFTRSEAVLQSVRLRSKIITSTQNRAELDRVGGLVGIEPGSQWLTGDDVVTGPADPEFAIDIASSLGDGSTGNTDDEALNSLSSIY